MHLCKEEAMNGEVSPGHTCSVDLNGNEKSKKRKERRKKKEEKKLCFWQSFWQKGHACDAMPAKLSSIKSRLCRVQTY